MGVSDVKGRAQIAVERLHFSKCESIIQRSERRFQKTLRKANIAGVSVRIPLGVTKAGTRAFGLTLR